MIVGICCLIACGVLGAFGGFFGLIKVVQYHLALPTFALALMVGAELVRGERSRTVIALGLALALPAPVIAHAAFIAPNKLRIETTEIDLGMPEPVRVVVIADLQTDRVGRHERRAIAAALEAKPDLILMPGDLFHASHARWNDRREAFLDLVDDLEAPFGVYAVLGNTDSPERLKPFLAETSIELLQESVAILEIRGSRVAVAGIGLEVDAPRARLALTQLDAIEADAKIVLAHYPDVIFVSQGFDDIDLVVAGHTHGGQVVIPGFGPPLTLSGVPRKVAAGGLNRYLGQQIYVSRGVGMERGDAPPVRFFCPPELSVLELR